MMDMLINIVWMIGESILVIFAGFICMKITQFYIKKIMTRWKSRLSVKKIDTVQSLLLSAAKYAISFGILFTVLEIFGFSGAATIAFTGIMSVAVGFAAQGFVKDIIMGVSILISNTFSVGDVLTIGSCTGKVEALGLQATKIRAANGDLHIIPNSEIKIVTRIHIDDTNKQHYQFPHYEYEEGNPAETAEETDTD